MGKRSRSFSIALVPATLLLTARADLCGASPASAGSAAATVPSSWADQVRQDVEAREYEMSWQAHPATEGIEPSWHAPNRAQGFRTYFTSEGIRVVPRAESAPGWRWGLSLVGVGKGGRDWGVPPPHLVGSGRHMAYHRGRLEESYENTPEGLEQRFVLQAPPGEKGAGDAPSESRYRAVPRRRASSDPDSTLTQPAEWVHLDLALWGDLSPKVSGDGQAIDFVTSSGAPVLRYAQLKVTDARGAILPAWMEGAGGGTVRGIRLVIDIQDAVYPLTIDPLATTAAWTAESDQADAHFGTSVAPAGDVNGDGFSDVLVGAPGYDSGQTDEGRAYLYLGSASGLAATPAWTAESDQEGAQFGTSVAPAGDVNGDGYSDILVGAPLYDNGQVDEGRIYLYLGSASGLAATAAWTAESDQASAGFGFSVQTAGSVNGDGYADIVVGAPYYDNGQNDEGRAFLYLGSASGLAALPAWTAESDQIASNFGVSVGTAGDVNGDGYADVLVGAPWYDNGQSDEGRAYVYMGSASGLAATPAWTAESNQTSIFNDGTLFGLSVSTAGDVNGDGYADVIIGCPHYDNGQRNEGRAFVYLGSASGLGATAAWTAESNSPDAEFGYSVSTAGDVNGDGYADVLVGSELNEIAQLDEGRAYLYLGSSSGLAVAPTWTAESGQISAFFGASVATAGDANGDGYSDVVVGANYYDNGQTDEGRAYLYLGSASGVVTTTAWMAESEQVGAQLGVSVASAGDVNGDGYSDVIVGASFYDNGLTDQGRALAYLGSASGLSSTPAWTADGPSFSGSHFGQSVASAGDVNGDGYADVIVGAPDFAGQGRVFVYLGSASGLGSTIAWNPVLSLPVNSLYGFSVASAGDVNADGFADIIASAPGYTDAQHFAGRADIFLGSASGLPQSPAWTAYGVSTALGPVASAGDVNGDGYSDVIVGGRHFHIPDPTVQRVDVYLGSASGPATNPAWTALGDQADAFFGASVASAGDVNGDGYSDVIIGAPLYLNGQLDEGRAYVYLGSGSGLAATPAWMAEGDLVGDQFGWSVASAGDVNGDGTADVIIGSPHTGNPAVGRANVYLGSASGLASSAAWTVVGDQTDSRFGFSVASAGDVNGDGYSDVIVGASLYDNGQMDEGRAFVYYGGGGDAQDRAVRQARSDGTAPIALLGKSDSESAILLRERGITAAGRGKVRLQWEVKPLGSPFSGSGLGASTVHDTGTPGASGSAVDFSETASGLLEGTFYHWRARIVSDDPLFPRSPWMSLAGNTITETKFRTAGCLDQDGDGYGAQGDPSCLSLTADCSDTNAALWGTPGETVNMHFSSATDLAWDPPSAPGATVSSLVYDTLRSRVASDFVSFTACLESDSGPDTVATDPTSPIVGQVFFYLTRAQDACALGQGSLGMTSSGVPRAGRSCP